MCFLSFIIYKIMAHSSDYGQHLWKCGIAWAEPSTWEKQLCFYGIYSLMISWLKYGYGIILYCCVAHHRPTTTNPTLRNHRNAINFQYLKKIRGSQRVIGAQKYGETHLIIFGAFAWIYLLGVGVKKYCFHFIV